jgi:hypothetical protein
MELGVYVVQAFVELRGMLTFEALAHRHDGPLGVRGLCRVAEEDRGINHSLLKM